MSNNNVFFPDDDKLSRSSDDDKLSEDFNSDNYSTDSIILEDDDPISYYIFNDHFIFRNLIKHYVKFF